MLKRILIAVLLWPLLAFGQSYPSPTFNNLTVNGTFTATGKVGLASLATQAANTVVANVTASSASPTAVAIPSCSTANSALQYTSGTGLSCGASFALTSGTLAQFAATTSAQLQGVVSDETGTGSLVFGTGPTISNPAISGGTISSASISGGTISGLTAPLSAAQGGTGRATLTTHGVLVGEGTAAVNQLTAGTTGQVLVGSTGADPAFGSTVGALTFTGSITPSSTAGIVGTTTNDNANAGSVGEFVTATQSSAVSLSNSGASNITSISLTAGDWDVSGVIAFVPANTTTVSNLTAGISLTSATVGGLGSITGLSIPFTSSGAADNLPTPVVRISVSTTTTVYLVALQGFGTSTMTATGTIRARRVR